MHCVSTIIYLQSKEIIYHKLCNMSQEKYKGKYRIASARNPQWDYSSAGGYFITICTAGRENYFGAIRDGKMELTVMGKIACNCWNEIPNHFPFVTLDEFIIMPDHVHGILIFYGTMLGVVSDRRDAKFCVSTPNTAITKKTSPIATPTNLDPNQKTWVRWYAGLNRR
jgi:hypothetical protein